MDNDFTMIYALQVLSMGLVGKQSVFLKQRSGQVKGGLSSGDCTGELGLICIYLSLGK